ncbi:hypothetical protein E4U53_004832, partial [Claviceps sorghi]
HCQCRQHDKPVARSGDRMHLPEQGRNAPTVFEHAVPVLSVRDESVHGHDAHHGTAKPAARVCPGGRRAAGAKHCGRVCKHRRVRTGWLDGEVPATANKGDWHDCAHVQGVGGALRRPRAWQAPGMLDRRGTALVPEPDGGGRHGDVPVVAARSQQAPGRGGRGGHADAEQPGVAELAAERAGRGRGRRDGGGEGVCREVAVRGGHGRQRGRGAHGLARHADGVLAIGARAVGRVFSAADAGAGV